MPPASKWIVPLMASSALGIEKWRIAAVGDRRAAGELRLRERTVDRRGQLGAPGAAHVAEEALQDAEVRVAGRLQRDPLVVEADRARHAQPRVVADELQLLDA